MKRKAKGFTIVELLIVIVVIGILAAISIVAYNNIQSKVHMSAVQSDMSNAAKKLEEYRTLNGRYPETLTELYDAGIRFTSNSWRYSGYCVQNSGSNPSWALVARTSGGVDFYRTSSNSGISGPVNWMYSTTLCESAGLGGAGAHWLRGLGNWNAPFS